MTTEDFLPYREPRQSAIELLVIHCNIFDKKKFLYWMNYYKTSCHYYISERGEISQLVKEEDKAYHAGIGTWRGKENINDRSIGIELENSTLGQTEYKKEQISALIRLSQNLIKKYNIKPENIIGHSDSAPTRKADPGLCFPWKELSKEGIGLYPNSNQYLPEDNIENLLQTIGYDTKDEITTQASAYAFCRHFAPQYVKTDPNIQHLVDNILPANFEFMKDSNFKSILQKTAYLYKV